MSYDVVKFLIVIITFLHVDYVCMWIKIAILILKLQCYLMFFEAKHVQQINQSHMCVVVNISGMFSRDKINIGWTW